jgi:hypothetical protein
MHMEGDFQQTFLNMNYLNTADQSCDYRSVKIPFYSERIRTKCIEDIWIMYVCI